MVVCIDIMTCKGVITQMTTVDIIIMRTWNVNKSNCCVTHILILILNRLSKKKKVLQLLSFFAQEVWSKYLAAIFKSDMSELLSCWQIYRLKNLPDQYHEEAGDCYAYYGDWYCNFCWEICKEILQNPSTIGYVQDIKYKLIKSNFHNCYLHKTKILVFGVIQWWDCKKRLSFTFVI